MSNPEIRGGTAAVRHTRQQRQRGVGLIELLVGMTIGLLVIAAAIGTLAISRGASASISDISELQQQGSFALRVIGRELRQAASVEPVRDATTLRYTFGAQYPTYAATNASVSGNDGANGSPDSLSVATFASPLLAQTQRRDCIDDAVSAGTKMEATFQVNSTTKSLTCTSNTNTPALAQPVIGNVADFQVRYRVETGGGTKIIDAAAVNAGQLWPSVKAIEVCLDLQGDEPLPDGNSSYANCSGTSTRLNGKVHLVFRNVFALRTQS